MVVSVLCGAWHATQIRPPDQPSPEKSCSDPVIVPANTEDGSSAPTTMTIIKRTKRIAYFVFIFLSPYEKWTTLHV